MSSWKCRRHSCTYHDENEMGNYAVLPATDMKNGLAGSVVAGLLRTALMAVQGHEPQQKRAGDTQWPP